MCKKIKQQIVAYCRVSTDNQAEEGTIEIQVRAIQEYCASNNLELIRIFKDEGVSGSLENRPALSEMFDYIESSDSLTACVIYRLDRLARDLYIQEMIIKKLQESHIKLLSLKETDLDSKDPMRVAFRQFVGIMSQLERAYITMRLREGRKNKARKGQYAGGRAAYGYKVEDSELAIDSQQADIIRKIFVMKRNKHYSLRQIASELNNAGHPTITGGQWNPSTVHYILKNPKYKGTIHYSGQSVKRKELAVV